MTYREEALLETIAHILGRLGRDPINLSLASMLACDFANEAGFYMTNSEINKFFELFAGMAHKACYDKAQSMKVKADCY